MARYGLLINASNCTGCTACTIACQMHNQLEPEFNFNRLEKIERGTYPNVRMEILPAQCMHCDNPSCVTVCPTGARKMELVRPPESIPDTPVPRVRMLDR